MSEKNKGSVLEEHQQLEQKKSTFEDLSDRSSDLTERSSDLTERSSDLTERSSELIERSSEVIEKSSELTEKSSELTERSSELTEGLAEKTSEEEGNELFLRIQKHLTNLTSLTIQKEKTLERLLASFQFSAEPFDLLLLKNFEQQLLKEFPLPEFQKVSSEAKETNSTEESELNSIKEPKTNDPAIILPNQRIFESCLFYLAKEGKRATRFLFVIILYLVFDFGFKIENLESLKRKDLLQIKQNKFQVKTRKYFVTKRAKRNFDLIEQYLGKEYFTKELVYSDSILSTSLARNFNKKLKTLAKIWNQSWTLQDFRFSFVRNMLLYEEIELDQFSTHYGVSLPRIYQLLTQRSYSTENIIEKIPIFPYVKFLNKDVF